MNAEPVWSPFVHFNAMRVVNANSSLELLDNPHDASVTDIQHSRKEHAKCDFCLPHLSPSLRQLSH
ncbi:hypothetical protein K2D_27130 [Planctomycetes bacterium K2D]|nr:hypothetical protein K2D_27130 [Planctomycetes bacterium K2D]